MTTEGARQAGHVAAVSCAVLVAGLGAALVVAGSNWTTPGVPAVIVGLLLLFFHTRPLRSVAKEGNVEVLQLDDVLYVPMLALLAPSEIFAVTALASIVGSIVTRRATVKAIFNVGSHLLACAAGIALAQVLGVSPSSDPHLHDALASMAGALAFTATTALLVRGMVSYATGANYLRSLRDVVDRVRPWIGAVVLGGVATMAIGNNPWSAILAAGMVIFVQRAFAAVFREISARLAAERLQRATSSLRTQTSSEAVLQDLLRATRDLTGAEKVTVLDPGQPCPDQAMVVQLPSGRALCLAGHPGARPWSQSERAMLETLAGVAGDVLRSTELIARLRTITYSQSEGVIAVDLDARVTFANPAAVKMTGHESEHELLGQRINDVCVLKQGTRPTDFAKMVAEETSERDVDAILLCPGVSSLDVAYSLTPLRTGTATRVTPALCSCSATSPSDAPCRTRWHTAPCTTSSPACRTAGCSPTDSTTRWRGC
jgi:PAS domain-containing protein